MRVWFAMRERKHLFAFETLCNLLDLDADWLRARLDALRPPDLPMKQSRAVGRPVRVRPLSRRRGAANGARRRD